MKILFISISITIYSALSWLSLLPKDLTHKTQRTKISAIDTLSRAQGAKQYNFHHDFLQIRSIASVKPDLNSQSQPQFTDLARACSHISLLLTNFMSCLQLIQNIQANSSTVPQNYKLQSSCLFAPSHETIRHFATSMASPSFNNTEATTNAQPVNADNRKIGSQGKSSNSTLTFLPCNNSNYEISLTAHNLGIDVYAVENSQNNSMQIKSSDNYYYSICYNEHLTNTNAAEIAARLAKLTAFGQYAHRVLACYDIENDYYGERVLIEKNEIL